MCHSIILVYPRLLQAQWKSQTIKELVFYMYRKHFYVTFHYEFPDHGQLNFLM